MTRLHSSANVLRRFGMLVFGLMLIGLVAAPSVAETVRLTGVTIHTGTGRTIEGGTIVVEDGRIVAVVKDGGASDGDTIDLGGMHITAGLIDANARIEPRDIVTTEPARRQGASIARLFHSTDHNTDEACTCSGLIHCALAEAHADLDDEAVCPICGYPGPPGVHDLISGVRSGQFTPTESSSEVVPHTWVVDSINLRSPDFKRLINGGVTTVFAAPDNAAVIGPRGAIVRTGGPMRERILTEASDVHAVVNPDTFRVGGGNSAPFRNFVSNRTRRPGSRMGVAWVFRKAFYDAKRVDMGLEYGGADAPPADAMPVLNEILAGDLPMRISARTQRDIETAFRVAGEFGVPFTLTEATEAHTLLPQLTEAGTRVVFGPIQLERPRRGEETQAQAGTLRQLLAAGIPTALSARDRRDEDGLDRQAMYAIRTGVSFEQALRAVTRTPAEFLGLDDDLGTVEVGKQADLVVWSDVPFSATARPVMVMIAGETVLDRRDD
ncbi:MAG: amidohydrolase family protein [Phycisphaerales bacterium]